MKFIFNFHFIMRWTNFLLQILSILATVYCSEKHNLYTYSGVLNSGMNYEINPCNDFYEYSCGKWGERNKIPEMLDEWNIPVMTEMTTVKIMKEILEKSDIDKSNKELVMERDFYDTCLDEYYSREEGEKLLKNILDETPWTSWQDVAEYYATKFSAFDLFHITLTGRSSLQIERPFYSESNKKPFHEITNEVTTRVLWLSNKIEDNSYIGEMTSDQYAMATDESLDFIDYVNQITYKSQQDIQTFSILQLQELYDNHCPSNNAKIEWLQFFQRLAEGTGTNFTEYDQIKVDIQYLKELCDLLSETPEHAIVNYLHYNFVFNKDTVIYTETDNMEKLNDTEKSIRCIRNLKITEGITKEIMRTYVPPENQEIVDEMVSNIKTEMMNEIENSWLVHDVKEAVLDRARNIKYNYGIPNDFYRLKLGRKVTYKFKVGPIGLQNELNLKRAQIVNLIQSYKNANKFHRGKRSFEANACYSRDENEFIIGVSLMFPPFFYQNAPIGFNYGRMGFTIGHEISHAFDFKGTQYTIGCSGSEYEDEMDSILEKRKNCFVNEFNSFGVDGLRTLNENVADTQGLKLALKAMKTAIKNQEAKNEGLPNFKYSNQEKLFFLSFANQWCSNPEKRQDEGVDEHAPFVTRVLGTLKNANEFAETFDCTRGEPMDPISKCDWWVKASTIRFKLFPSNVRSL